MTQWVCSRTWRAGVLALFLAATARGEDWKPVDPALMAAKSPVVEKDADAEAIFWEVRINDSEEDLIFSHYVRIKVFTERGKESQSQIEIPYFGRFKITDVAGRTIKPDGSIVELKKDAVFDRTEVRAGDIKIKVKSFAMPGVEPGAIIEYRWREIRPSVTANNVRLQFQRDIPVQLVKYYIKPFGSFLEGMSAQTFHGPNVGFVKEKDGFYSIQLTNMPAFREEPYMPPEDQVRTWMRLFYGTDDRQHPEKYWSDIGKRVYELIKPKLKPNDELRKTAASVIGDAATPDDKLQRLFDFCQTKIKNLSNDASGITADERKKLKENDNPSDTLKRGMGSGDDINLLFGALAMASGFEARPILLPDRGDIFFEKNFIGTSFLESISIAVKTGESWRFFDPSSMYVPFGMLRWREEYEPGLVCDSQPVFVNTPLSPPEKSLYKRRAKLKLSDDGSLEGDVRMEYHGHPAAEKKEANDDQSPAEREKTLKGLIKKHLSTAEVSQINIENVTDPVKPFTYSFHVKVAGYAERTGKRLFLQPAFFQKGVGPIFTTTDRRYQVYFHYPWTEEDEVVIELPEGFVLDSADSPGPFTASDVVKYDVSIGTSGTKVLTYKRKFYFNGVIFPPNVYPTLKQVFDEMHKRDNHMITLKQGSAN